jgi:flagellar biosynthesis/type III secretory pathway protein FliH
MLAKEWDFDEELRVRKEEGREEGREEGWEEGWEKGRDVVFSVMDQAKSMDELRKMLETAFAKRPGQGG